MQHIKTHPHAFKLKNMRQLNWMTRWLVETYGNYVWYNPDMEWEPSCTIVCNYGPNHNPPFSVHFGEPGAAVMAKMLMTVN